jgi:hypothetical protein
VCVADTLNNRIAAISHLMGEGMPCRTRRDAYAAGPVFGLIRGLGTAGLGRTAFHQRGPARRD